MNGIVIKKIKSGNEASVNIRDSNRHSENETAADVSKVNKKVVGESHFGGETSLTEKIIKFDRWWKKLIDRKIGDIFSTYRRDTSQKSKYYLESLNEDFIIVVTDTKDGFKGFNDKTDYLELVFEVTGTFDDGKVSTAELISVIKKHGSDITEEEKRIDTEYLEEKSISERVLEELRNKFGKNFTGISDYADSNVVSEAISLAEKYAREECEKEKKKLQRIIDDLKIEILTKGECTICGESTQSKLWCEKHEKEVDDYGLGLWEEQMATAVKQERQKVLDEVGEKVERIIVEAEQQFTLQKDELDAIPHQTKNYRSLKLNQQMLQNTFGICIRDGICNYVKKILGEMK